MCYLRSLVIVLAMLITTQMTSIGFAQFGMSDWTATSDPNDLLTNPDIQDAIELTDDQIQKVIKVNAKWKVEIRERLPNDISKLYLEDPDNAQKTIDTAMADIRTGRESDLIEVLLPHQRKRLVQICLQTIHVRGNRTLINSALFKNKFDVTDEECTKLVNALPEREKELEKKIAKLRAEMRREWFSDVLGRKRSKEIEAEFGENHVAQKQDSTQFLKQLGRTKREK